MIEGDIYKMDTTDVSNIIQRGGTILKTARSKEFMTDAGMQKANVWGDIDDGFAVKLDHEAQHTVGAGVMWPHVEHHGVGFAS
jgi:hypothetical protein